ncbi:MAG: sodium:solute symporter [Bacteroidaceae bacterium]|nr:sodium:solute symporter [Bacteroidaceae bacterium]
MKESLILIILACYFGILMLISYLTGKKSNNKTFFTGNKQSPWILVAFGMIGTSISGVTFVSVPGMPLSIDMTYMQTVLGFSVGYLVVAHLLLPLYYKLNLTSIYTYLRDRFGNRAYKTGASFFLLSKIIGAAARLYIVVLILQHYVFDRWQVPFIVTTGGIVLLIWLYSHKSGIKTIVWTDALQTFFLLGALVLIIHTVMNDLNFDFTTMIRTVMDDERSHIFVFDDWYTKQNFFKQFISGIFITIVMSGLDQDMMQKNLSCRTLKDSQKNMYSYGMAFIPVNLLFLSLGILLAVYAETKNISLPALSDEMLPMFATQYLGSAVIVFFSIGIIAAAFSSADSALTALTTSFCIDILDVEKFEENRAEKIRKLTHISISVLFVLIILVIKAVNNKSIIDAIYIIASYTYGPLLGLFSFGLFTKLKADDKWIPYIAFISPIFCFLLDLVTTRYTDYRFGYELLMMNGLFTFFGLYLTSVKAQLKHNRL